MVVISRGHVDKFWIIFQYLCEQKYHEISLFAYVACSMYELFSHKLKVNFFFLICTNLNKVNDVEPKFMDAPNTTTTAKM